MIPLILATSMARADVVLDEQFDGDALGEKWQWTVPVEGPTYSLTERPGWLRMHIPQHEDGYNHWVGVTDAPLLTAPVPDEDWDAECRLQLAERGPDSTFHLGFSVVFAPDDLLTVGPFRAPQFEAPEPEVWAEPTSQGGYRKAGGPAEDLSILFRRRGWSCEMLVKRPGDAEWESLGNYYTADAPQAVAILGKTFGPGQAVTLDVDYVQVTTVDNGAGGQPMETTTIRVDAGGELTRLDERRRGHFVELMHRCFYGGFWAEMLFNRKFTGEVSEAGVIEGWEPVGEGATYSRDNATYYVPAQSQRIEAPGGPGVGIRQAGLELSQGVGVEGRVVMRSLNEGFPVTVRVTGGGETLAEKAFSINSDWQTCEFAFGDEVQGMEALEIVTEAQGAFWVGCASLMPDDNVDGFRRDVLALCRKMQIPSLRYPGGNFVSGYHWEDGIGPRDQRPPRWDRAWNQWEWNDVGTHEYFRLCELLECEPFITVNAGEGTPAEGAAWVEYVLGTADTPQGHRRELNGRQEPWNCPLWSIGNEMYGGWQLGHVDATKYAIRTVEFAELMRGVAPDIELIVNGVEGPNPWNVTQAQITGHIVDYISVHHYTNDNPEWSPLENYAHIVQMPVNLERMLQASYDEVAQHSVKPLPIMFDEWNVWTRIANQQGYEDFYQLRDGLYAVGVLNAVARLGEKCPGAHVAQTVNVLGAIRTTKTQAVSSPLALAFQLHAEHRGAWLAPATVQTPELELPGSPPMPAVDAVAMLSEDRSELHLLMVNRHPTEEALVHLDLDGFAPTSARTTTMDGPSHSSINTFDQPNTVTLERGKLAADGWEELTLPPHSAVGVTMARAR